MAALSVIKFNVVNLAFKTRASSIHLNKFAPGYPQKKNFHFSLLQSVSSKRAGHTVAFDFASQGFLAFHSVIKKSFLCFSCLTKRMNKDRTARTFDTS